MADDKLKAVILSNRKTLLNGVRQALAEAKFAGEKLFTEDAQECLSALASAEEAIAIIDWDMGAAVALKFFEGLKEIPQREFFSTFLMATEQSDKIVAAGAELGVTRIHTGPVTPVKIRIAVEELIKDIDAAAPLKNLMQKINEARNNSEWAASTAILEELYKKDPKNKRVVYELAENYLQEKKWQRSYELLKPLIGAMPPDSRILHAAGKALIKLGKPEDAAAVMQKADFINPFNVERLLDLGNVFLTLDKTRKASEIFDRAGQLDPENPEVAKGQGTAKLMDGDVNEALRIMKDAVTGRELASVFNTAAVLSMRLGRFPKGLNLYEAAEKVLKDKPDILARIFFNKGLGFYRWKKLEDAQKCFEQALKLDPAYINAQHNLRAVIAELTQPKSMAAGAEVPSGLDDVKFDDSMKDVFNDNLMEEDERI